MRAGPFETCSTARRVNCFVPAPANTATLAMMPHNAIATPGSTEPAAGPYGSAAITTAAETIASSRPHRETVHRILLARNTEGRSNAITASIVIRHAAMNSAASRAPFSVNHVPHCVGGAMPKARHVNSLRFMRRGAPLTCSTGTMTSPNNWRIMPLPA